MEIKLFEVRDRMTLIPMMAIKLNGVEDRLLRFAGYGLRDYVLMGNLNKGTLSYNIHEWGDRTYTTAHQYIFDNWETLKNGDVVDVMTILGETSEPVPSDINLD